MVGRPLLLLLVAGCGRLGFAAQTDAGGEPGMLFHLTFDGVELLRDSTQAHHDGMCSGNCPLQIGGRVGAGAAAYSGTECVVIRDALDLRPAAFTIALWATLEPGSGGDLAARSLNGATNFLNTWELEYDGLANIVGMHLQVQGTNVPYGGGWNHLAATYDGGELALYVAGMLAMTSAGRENIQYAADDIRLGCDFDVGGNVGLLHGSLDDVRMYNRVLAADEIAALAAM